MILVVTNKHFKRCQFHRMYNCTVDMYRSYSRDGKNESVDIERKNASELKSAQIASDLFLCLRF